MVIGGPTSGLKNRFRFVAAIRREFGSFADARIEAVARIELPIEICECGLRFVQVPDVVFSRIFGAARIEQPEHLVFERHAVVPLHDDILLVEHMT